MTNCAKCGAIIEENQPPFYILGVKDQVCRECYTEALSKEIAEHPIVASKKLLSTDDEDPPLTPEQVERKALSFFFYMRLGYRITDDDDDEVALFNTVQELIKNPNIYKNQPDGNEVIPDLKSRIQEQWEKTKATVPCNFKGSPIWSNCRECNGMRLDKTQHAFKCGAWVPETIFEDKIF